MVKAIVGACWGDEGKGKITDVLAENSDLVVRFQGGSNAGHTIINEYGKFALHQLPSGVFRQNIINVIGNGVAILQTNSARSWSAASPGRGFWFLTAARWSCPIIRSRTVWKKPGLRQNPLVPQSRG